MSELRSLVMSHHWHVTCAISVTVIVMSRLVYRKGADFLGVIIPDICSHFPMVDFIVGKLIVHCGNIMVQTLHQSICSCHVVHPVSVFISTA